MDLSRNELTIINADTFSDLKHLKVLILSHNKIITIRPGTFEELKNLICIDVSENRLTDLVPCLFKELKLEGFSLRGNLVKINKFVCANFTYEGEWHNGVRQGQGKMVLANGDVFEGEFLNDKRSGPGKYVWADGTVFEGSS